MLKYIRGVVLIVTVLLVSACVSPTHAASSADVVITQIQAGGVGGALQEIVVVYNNSTHEVNVTNWCLKNKSDVQFACFLPSVPYEGIILPAHGYATVGSTAIVGGITPSGFTVTYAVTNQSSGSIIGSADTISLINTNRLTVDVHSWTVGLNGGMSYYRHIASAEPTIFIDTDQVSDWVMQTTQPIPESQIIRRYVAPDECSNIEGDQPVIPDGMEVDDIGVCTEIVDVSPPSPSPVLPIRITELLPNVEGSDAGKEFIELYNPNEQPVPLQGYTVWYGLEFEKSTLFPDDAVLLGVSYAVFSNEDIAFSLLNTSSRVRITNAEGSVVDETPTYIDPADDEAWAYIDGMWQYTNRPTPGSVNLVSNESLNVEEDVSTQKPCASNQYRSPETNHCRLIASNAGTVTPCKDDQYRSEETNRCRNIVTETVAACKEGQERNPDTNRCRNIVKVSNADYAVLGASDSKDGSKWYVWVAIGIVLLLALAYAIWEWRFEIRKLLAKVRTLVRIRK